MSNEARKFASDVLGGPPAWMTQVTTLADGSAHPSGGSLSVVYAAVVPANRAPPTGLVWANLSALPTLTTRQSEAADLGIGVLRDRMDLAPIAFQMLESEFTLSALQGIYELLLGKRLHKASFRRALQASYLVEPTDEWHSEGRGRPAQLFRFAPRKRRGARRGVRFDLFTE